jgi:hypothetical protein
MRTARPPWWMFVVAASFVGLVALIPYLVIWGPDDPEGLDATFDHDTMQVRAVAPDTPLQRAGPQASDQILSVGGRPVKKLSDWSAVLANLEAERPQLWRIARGEQQLEFEITPARATWQNRMAHSYILYSALAASYFILGLFVAFRRSDDLVARIGAWFITTASIGF